MYGGSNYTNNRKERENYGLSHQCWIDVGINHQRPISLISIKNKLRCLKKESLTKRHKCNHLKSKKFQCNN